MTDEEYENLIGEVAAEFHEKFIAGPDREDSDTMKIAVDYTVFILSAFAAKVAEFEQDQ